MVTYSASILEPTLTPAVTSLAGPCATPTTTTLTDSKSPVWVSCYALKPVATWSVVVVGVVVVGAAVVGVAVVGVVVAGFVEW